MRRFRLLHGNVVRQSRHQTRQESCRNVHGICAACARILNTPEIDPEAYQRSSPINHAAGLQRPLLIAVGMQDDNVFFQDSVLLVQRLIELEKENFEIAIYPLDAHSFVHPASWLDEYRRIFRLMETQLK